MNETPTPLSRRGLLAMAAAAGATVLAACSSDGSGAETSSASNSAGSSTAGTTAGTSPATTREATTATTAASTTASTAASTTDAASCEPIPEETAGPFPGDGSNGPDVLAEADVVRSDIRSSIGSASGVADGVPMTIELTLTDTAAGCTPLANAAVYLWHCDREGQYSMYSGGAESENYLRGVQVSDADGRLTFMSIFPACYSGRWPHAHFELYASVEDATGGGEPIATSQLALPQDTCDVVYATTGYEQSVRNLSQLSLDSDMVFSDDDAVHQMATMTGDASSGYTAALTVAV
jgi:protocatechuate 3,4-dioxygenase beta subunit